MSFDQLLAGSDIMSIYVPLNASKWHLIAAEHIRRMKSGVVLLNAGRDVITDEAAMAEALEVDDRAGYVLART